MIALDLARVRPAFLARLKTAKMNMTPFPHLLVDDVWRGSQPRHFGQGDGMPGVGKSDLGLFSLSAATYLELLPLFADQRSPGAVTQERNFLPLGDFDLLFGAQRLWLRIMELPFRYRERTYGTTNRQQWRHGWLLLRMTVFAARRVKFI